MCSFLLLCPPVSHLTRLPAAEGSDFQVLDLDGTVSSLAPSRVAEKFCKWRLWFPENPLTLEVHVPTTFRGFELQDSHLQPDFLSLSP